MAAMEKCDLIENLDRRSLDHIIEQIFGYLDYDSLRQAEMVSVGWQKVVSVRRFWKTLFFKKIAACPEWKKLFTNCKGTKLEREFYDQENSVDYFHKVYCSVADEMLFLESNWKNMKYFEHRIANTGASRTNSMFADFTDMFELNGNWIVQKNEGSRPIIIRNRWTLETELVLEVPHLRTRFWKTPSSFRSVKMNDDFITASFYRQSEICVWNRKTKELVSVINGGMSVLQSRGQGDEERQGVYESYRYHTFEHCLCNNLLLSCHVKSSNGSWVLALWKISTNVAEKPVLLHEAKMEDYFNEWLDADNSYDVTKIAMDEMFTVLIYEHDSNHPDVNVYEIIVLSTSSFERVNEFTFNGVEEQIHLEFDYRNGLLATFCNDDYGYYSAGDIITISRVDKKCSIGLIASPTLSLTDFVSFRLVSDNYIIILDDEWKVYDVKAASTAVSNDAVDKTGLATVASLSTIPLSENSSDGDSFTYLVDVDEFQVVTVIRKGTEKNGYTYSLCIKNFLEAAK